MNIYEKIFKVTHEASQVSKGMTVKLPNGSYKAVSEGNVLGVIKPLLEKYGVLIIPVNRQILGSPYFTYKKDGGEKFVFYSRVKTSYKIVNVDDPTDFITTESYGDGLDSMDKSTGKAITYCDKYNILKLFMMISGEDTDQEASTLIESNDKPSETKAKKYSPSEPEIPASDKQLRYIEALKLQKVYSEAIFRGQFGFFLSDVDTNEKARIVISFLQQCPAKAKQEPKADEQGIIVDDDLPF